MAHLLLELNPSRTTWHTSLEIFNPSGMTESSRGDRTETASLILGYSLISFNTLATSFVALADIEKVIGVKREELLPEFGFKNIVRVISARVKRISSYC